MEKLKLTKNLEIGTDVFFKELFSVLSSESYYYKDFILLNLRYLRAEKNFNLGTLSKEIYDVELSRIINAILETLELLYEENLANIDKGKPNSITQTINHFWDSFFNNKTTIVIGPFSDQRFKEWDASTLMATGDALALSTIIGLLNSIGVKNYEVIPSYNFTGDRYQNNLILIGGPDANSISKEYYSKIDTIVKLGNPDLNEISFYDSERQKTYSPKYDSERNVIGDYGLLYKFPNYRNNDSEVIIIAGCFGFGTFAAAQLLESEKMIETIEGIKSENGFEALVYSDIIDNWTLKPQLVKNNILGKKKF